MFSRTPSWRLAMLLSVATLVVTASAQEAQKEANQRPVPALAGKANGIKGQSASSSAPAPSGFKDLPKDSTQDHEKRPKPNPGGFTDASGQNLAIETPPIRFLFLYREGSISPEQLKRFVEGLERVIKYKVSPERLAKGAQTPELELMTIEDLGRVLGGTQDLGTLPGGMARQNEKKDDIASGAKLTKADAARSAKSPTLGELFKRNGPILFFNLKQKDGGEGCPPNCATIVDRKGGIFCMCLLDFNDYPKLKPVDIDLRVSSVPYHLIVITFNQGPQTEREFRKLFCSLYHNDCKGPIGKPTPLPDPVTVRTYASLNWNEPIKDEETLRAALQKRAIGDPGKLEGIPPQRINCMRRNSNGACDWWRICGNLAPDGGYRCYDIIYCGPGIGWQVAW